MVSVFHESQSLMIFGVLSQQLETYSSSTILIALKPLRILQYFSPYKSECVCISQLNGIDFAFQLSPFIDDPAKDDAGKEKRGEIKVKMSLSELVHTSNGQVAGFYKSFEPTGMHCSLSAGPNSNLSFTSTILLCIL